MAIKKTQKWYDKWKTFVVFFGFYELHSRTTKVATERVATIHLDCTSHKNRFVDSLPTTEEFHGLSNLLRRLFKGQVRESVGKRCPRLNIINTK